MLDVDAVDRDVVDEDVAVRDTTLILATGARIHVKELGLPCDVAGRIEVGLDPGTVLAVDASAVRERDVCHIVVTLASDTADAQTMAALAVHVRNINAVAARDSYAVVLIEYDAIAKNHVVGARDVVAVGIVSRG